MSFFLALITIIKKSRVQKLPFYLRNAGKDGKFDYKSKKIRKIKGR